MIFSLLEGWLRVSVQLDTDKTFIYGKSIKHLKDKQENVEYRIYSIKKVFFKLFSFFWRFCCLLITFANILDQVVWMQTAPPPKKKKKKWR